MPVFISLCTPHACKTKTKTCKRKKHLVPESIFGCMPILARAVPLHSELNEKEESRYSFHCGRPKPGRENRVDPFSTGSIFSFLFFIREAPLRWELSVGRYSPYSFHCRRPKPGQEKEHYYFVLQSLVRVFNAWCGQRHRASALTRYCFASKLYDGSQSFLYPPPPPAKPTLLQHYCTTIAQYTPPHRPPLFMPYTMTYW